MKLRYEFVPGSVVNSILSLADFLKQNGQEQCLAKAFEKLSPYFLISFGDIYSSKTSETLDQCLRSFESYQTIFDNGALLFLDSGGYQISSGRIRKEDLPVYVQLYYDFVNCMEEKLKDKFHTYFYLDVVLGEKGKLGDLYEVEKWCIESIDCFTRTVNETLRSKFLFVLHTSSFDRYRIWTNLMNRLYENGYVSNRYSIGGLVSGGGKYRESYVLHWVYGLLFLIQWFQKNKLKFSSLDLHILGIVEVNYLVTLYLVSLYLLMKYNLSINFTYDGTALVNKFLLGRLVGYIGRDKMYKNLSFTSKNLYSEVEPGLTVNDYVLSLFREIWDIVDYKPSENNNCIYEYKGGPFVKDCGVWLPFIEPLLHKRYAEVYVPISERVVEDIIQDNWNSLLDFLNTFLGNQSVKNRKLMYRKIRNSLLLLDKAMEGRLDYCEDVLVPCLAVSEIP